MKKRLAGLLSLVMLLVLTGCGRSDVTAATPGVWEKLVYAFAQIIKFLSFGGSISIGIILFTLIIRTALLPLMNIQIKSSRRLQEIQPQLKALQAKYPGKDPESRRLLSEETQILYSENNANPMIGCLPLLIQLPILTGLYQALTRVDFLRDGHFLWLDISQKDPYYILPILAALFTFVSSWLTMKATSEKNNMTTSMTYLLPVMILFMSLNMASGVTLYWTVSNAFQAFQTLLLNNPFKIQREREASLEAEKAKIRAKEKALKKATKKK
ncbi:YidC/Oxa1 family membrane protein insertase [Streptococcaceae bacterium ESL0729]|nr:YidC/Oxa1 family membrane protein insertase [Streptococcaceae bacterium ESL0729]